MDVIYILNFRYVRYALIVYTYHYSLNIMHFKFSILSHYQIINYKLDIIFHQHHVTW